MNWEKFEAKANDIWSEFWGVIKFYFWDMPMIFIQLGLYLLGILILIGLIVGAIAFVISIIF